LVAILGRYIEARLESLIYAVDKLEKDIACDFIFIFIVVY
jgi:hypothetical protein